MAEPTPIPGYQEIERALKIISDLDQVTILKSHMDLRCVAVVKTKLQEARMWLDESVKEPNTYHTI